MYNITFQQLGTFMAVAERLNLSETANALYISQPALSKMIHRLEEGVGMKLFVRSNRGVALTAEGEYLYEHMRTPYRTICKTIDNARLMNAKRRRCIRIGYPSTFDASDDYGPVKEQVSAFAAANPGVELVEMLYDFADLRDALKYGDVDVAFAHDFVTEELDDMLGKTVAYSSMCIAMSNNHPAAKLASFDPAAVQGETFVSVGFRDEADNIAASQARLSKNNIIPGEIKFAPNFQSMMRMICQGKAMSLCGYFPKAPGAEDVKFYPLPEKARFCLWWRPDDMADDTRRFVDAVKSID